MTGCTMGFTFWLLTVNSMQETVRQKTGNPWCHSYGLWYIGGWSAVLVEPSVSCLPLSGLSITIALTLACCSWQHHEENKDNFGQLISAIEYLDYPCTIWSSLTCDSNIDKKKRDTNRSLLGGTNVFCNGFYSSMFKCTSVTVLQNVDQYEHFCQQVTVSFCKQRCKIPELCSHFQQVLSSVWCLECFSCKKKCDMRQSTHMSIIRMKMLRI
jgi:hypothetical protein